MSLLTRLLLGHIIGDFVLQTIDLVRYKATSWRGQLIHSAIVTLCTALFLWERLPAWWLWLVPLFVMHLLTDWTKVTLDRYFPRWGVGLFFFDQLSHLAAMVVVIRLAAGGWPYSSLAAILGGATVQANRNLLYLLAFLTAFFIVPILEIQIAATLLERLEGKCTSKNGLPASIRDRLWGGGERTVALLLLYIGGGVVWFVPLAFLPRFLLVCRREPQARLFRLCWIKWLISVVGIAVLAIALGLLQSRL